MARPGLRRIAPWVLAALVGIAGATGAASIGSRRGPAVDGAVRAAAAELPHVWVLPPAAGERFDSVTERSEPVGGAIDVVLATGVALLALGATGFAARADVAAATARHRRGSGATRGPPVAG